LPPNFTLVSLGSQEDYGNTWTDALIPFFKEFDEDYFTVLLEDYWLVSPVDMSRLESFELKVRDGLIDRADLGNGVYPHYPYDEDTGLHIVSQRADYRNSLQPAIWRKEYFMKFLKPGRTPWQFEGIGMNEARNDGAVIASLPSPPIFDYANIFLKGELHQPQIDRISCEDMDELRERGFIE